MESSVPARSRDRRASSVPGEKGLKPGALGFVSNLVIGVASTAPAYSIAATLGFIVAHQRCRRARARDHARRVHPDPLRSRSAYRYLNLADPDAGTTFAWVTRAMGPQIGWINGWAIFLADIIVMASLSEIAGTYTFQLFGWTSAANSTAALIIAAVVWIAVMTWICYRGIELSARLQTLLLSFECAMLGIFSVVALVKVFSGPGGLDQAFDSLVQPVRDWLDALISGSCWGSSSTGAGTRASRSTRSRRTRPRVRVVRPCSRPCCWS